ncbi:hypothetical protein BYT27DRAFT_7244246 [Phlegmacium glaucopus]|nr:hypothetical protein BYT27DRAFT_7244246 [Phlegmacium glaucopus]
MSAHTSDEHEKNPEYVARGFKAAIHNPNVSAEAKAHAVQQLEEMGINPTSDSDAQQRSEGDEHVHRQLGGYKATLSNKHASEEAKKHAQSVLDRVASEEAKHEHRIMGGYKATLKNPHTSEEAKQHAEQILREQDK